MALLSSVPTPAREERAVAVAIAGLETALPPLRFTQQEALEFILARFPVNDATKALYRRVLGDGAVKTRHFALDALEEVLEPDPDRVNARFEKWGAALSARALAGALDGAGLAAEGLDFLAAATCTGYLCPGLSAYAAEAAGLRPDAGLADLAGMGCGAALPALEQAYNFLQAHPDSSAAAVCTEICSAAVFSDDAADLVVSNALFADGSAAAVLKAAPPGEKGGGPVLRGFASLTVPAWRDTLRFRTEGGRLRNVLGREVPAQAAQALESVSADLLGRFGLARADVGRWILHPGGRKVLDAAQERLGLPPEALLSSRRVLERCGNMSSPSVLFVLKEEMESRPPRRGEWGFMASFGAGFSAHAALLEF